MDGAVTLESHPYAFSVVGESPRAQVASESEGSLVMIWTPALSLLTVICRESAGSEAQAVTRARQAAMAGGDKM